MARKRLPVQRPRCFGIITYPFELLNKISADRDLRAAAEARKQTEMPKSTRTRNNTKWTDDEDERLATLLAKGQSWTSIATELKRSYKAVEARAWKLKRLPAEMSAAIDNANRAEAVYRPKISDSGRPMNLSCHAISDAAMAAVNVLYSQASAYRTATVAKSYTYQKLKPRLQRVIGAIVRELLSSHRERNLEWVKVSVNRVRASQIGVSEEVLQNLLDALEHSGFVERLTGYAGTLELKSSVARGGRATRVRGTLKLFDLCAQHQITGDNAATHFKMDQEKSPNDAVAF